jgi:hypothetical protein
VPATANTMPTAKAAEINLFIIANPPGNLRPLARNTGESGDKKPEAPTTRRTRDTVIFGTRSTADEQNPADHCRRRNSATESMISSKPNEGRNPIVEVILPKSGTRLRMSSNESS